MEEPSATGTLEAVEALKKAIWSKRPILGDIMQKHGGKLLSDYAKDFMDVNPAPGLDERKPELIALVSSLVEGRLSKDVAEGVSKQLTKLPLVSTADHHASIDHPFWVNANIISGIKPYEDPDPDIRYLIVFSFASVSVNNASGFSRGILFTSGIESGKNIVRLPILPDKLKMSVVYGTRTFTREELTRAEDELLRKEAEGEIAKGQASAIRQFLEENFATPKVLGASQLCSQITRINFEFWRKIFHGPKGTKASGNPVPDLIYMDIETIVTQLLLRRHLDNPSSLIYRLLFEPAFMQRALKQFDGLPGAFSLEEGWGTYMFWGITDKRRRACTRLIENELHFIGDDVRIPWNPTSIKKALEEKRIFPGMLLCYVIISLYYGMKCLGGFCQVHDLTVIKKAWMEILRSLDETKEAEAVNPVQTKELGGDGMVLSYLKTASGDLVPATGIDMALDSADTSFGRYTELSKRVTLMEMMSALLPEMYTVLYPEQERDQSLATIPSSAILKALGLTKRLSSF